MCQSDFEILAGKTKTSWPGVELGGNQEQTHSVAGWRTWTQDYQIISPGTLAKMAGNNI